MPKRTKEGRVIRPNPDGTVSTEITKTYGFNTGTPEEFYMNVPTLDEKGRDLPDDEAIRRVQKAGGKDPVTGKTLIKFAKKDDALKAAKQRTGDLGKLYGQKPKR